MRIPAFTLALCLSMPPALAAAPSADLAVVNARVVASPDSPVINGATVLVENGMIVAVGLAEQVPVPEGTPVLDARGGILTAGFWNSHVHSLAPPLSQAEEQPAPVLETALREMLLRWGFTTAFDLAGFNGNAGKLKARIEEGEVAGPQVLHLDTPFFPADGTPVYVRDLMAGIGAPSAEVASPAQARRRAEAQLAAGADGVKLFVGAIMGHGVVNHMDPEVAAAAVSAANAAGKPTFAHPTDRAGILVAIDSGVDVLAHTTSADGPWDAGIIARLRAADIAVIPTLTLFEWELQRENVPAPVAVRLLGDAVAQLHDFHAAGGTVLFGTDVGYTDHVDTRHEYQLMGQAGLPWRAVLASLTTAPAARFGQRDLRGRIATGQAADLVLLGSDPAIDLSAFGDVRATVRGGRVLYRSDALD